MYGPPVCRKRKTKVTGWSAQMYPAFVEHKLLALDGMRCALVLLSNAALESMQQMQWHIRISTHKRRQPFPHSLVEETPVIQEPAVAVLALTVLNQAG